MEMETQMRDAGSKTVGKAATCWCLFSFPVPQEFEALELQQIPNLEPRPLHFLIANQPEFIPASNGWTISCRSMVISMGSIADFQGVPSGNLLHSY